MLYVFFTVDVEVWCNGWHDLDRRFPDAFARRIYGATTRGNYGLPAILALLNDHGLAGVFFVEPLFAMRFGQNFLDEVVGLVTAARQEVQLHLHTEWVDEAQGPLRAGVITKRQFLWMYTHDEQVRLINAGIAMLRRAGASRPCAFRDGNFGISGQTWSALRACGISSRFAGLDPRPVAHQPSVSHGALRHAGLRIVEQALRINTRGVPRC